jgi:membrane-anchored protein YejM (alkaline phosphatase superfamily)
MKEHIKSTKKEQKMSFDAETIEIMRSKVIMVVVIDFAETIFKKENDFMMKKNLKRIIASMLMVTTLIGSSCVANAATAVTDYGTMTYSLKKKFK